MAGTFPVPAENPIATVSIPDNWGPNAYDGGVEGTSADGKIYVAFESVDAADVKSATEEGLKYFIKNGVTIDSDSHEDEGHQDQRSLPPSTCPSPARTRTAPPISA